MKKCGRPSSQSRLLRAADTVPHALAVSFRDPMAFLLIYL